MSQEQNLIWALRKELAAKSQEVNNLQTQNENLVDQVTTLQVENAKLSRESTQTEVQSRLHSIYEKKLADAVEDEKIKMHAEFTVQLEEQL